VCLYLSVVFALKLMLAKVMKVCPDIVDRLRALPRELCFADMFSGTGSAYIVTQTLFDVLMSRFPKALAGVKVICLMLLFECSRMCKFPPSVFVI